MKYSGKYYQGKYTVKNPEKYRGDVSNVIYRSSWELRFMIWCDTNPKIKQFSSEETIIPYVSPKDGRPHRYFVDFKIVTDKNKTFLVEIKPKAQCRPPRNGKNYLTEGLTYMINQSKWSYAKQYAEDRNWSFIVLTEDDLGIPK